MCLSGCVECVRRRYGYPRYILSTCLGLRVKGGRLCSCVFVRGSIERLVCLCLCWVSVGEVLFMLRSVCVSFCCGLL